MSLAEEPGTPAAPPSASAVWEEEKASATELTH